MDRLRSVALRVVGLAVGPVLAGDFDGSRVLICAPRPGRDRTEANLAHPARGQVRARLVLQGMQLGYGWTIALDQGTGKMAATLANREGVFVLFGACIVP